MKIQIYLYSQLIVESSQLTCQRIFVRVEMILINLVYCVLDKKYRKVQVRKKKNKKKKKTKKKKNNNNNKKKKKKKKKKQPAVFAVHR